ncbi:hypothetical protein DXG03_007754 [Asterophora parasitica]|uniref:Uncharacterized protein n=1 Tax=Asterophora parasitica TaxID=117018 RepID=A0A9P7GID3_9AGAR|nr:hypothetical protein DXG03_007754 [Asterophora parasitica]
MSTAIEHQQQDGGSDIKKTDSLDIDRPESFDLSNALPSRPPMVYSSPVEFLQSFGRRWKSVWTPRFTMAILCGQLVSLCITCTNVTTTELVSRNWALPTTQTFFLCVDSSDQITDKDWSALNRAKGDAFMIAGATLYGITNSSEEFLVRKRPLYEVVGQLGLYGTLINGIQASALEHKGMKTATWNSMTTMFILYTVAPIIYRLASSTYFNLSLLSSDFWGLLFGLFLYKYHPYWLYFVAFVVILGGLITYFWYSTPEEQGNTDPTAPEYVNKRGAAQRDNLEAAPAPADASMA